MNPNFFNHGNDNNPRRNIYSGLSDQSLVNELFWIVRWEARTIKEQVERLKIIARITGEYVKRGLAVPDLDQFWNEGEGP